MAKKSNKSSKKSLKIQDASKGKKKRIVQTKPIEKIETPKSTPKLGHENDWSNKQIWFCSAFFFLLAVILYSNTFNHRFVLDDHGIINDNKITKAAFSWENTKLMFSTPLRIGDGTNKEESLYRPVIKTIFNAQWNFFEGDPHGFHKVNVILYGLLCMLIFWALFDLFNRRWLLPFFITLLFTVHPIHVEVVANIKSLDEIMAMIGIVGAMRAIQLYLKSNKLIHVAWGTLIFTIGIFSKESTIVGMAIFPLLVYYQEGKIDWKKIATVCVPLLVVSIGFVACWKSITHINEPSVMDNLIIQVKDNIPSRFATAVMIAGFYIYTFFVPHPLACDYSYSTLEPVGPSHLGFIFTLVLCIAGLVYAIKNLKSRSKISFAILWFFITFSIGSNVLFLIGTSFGERLFFTPSLGMCILTVCLLAKFLQKEGGVSFIEKLKRSPVLTGIVLLVAVLYSVKSYARNADWKNEYELFSRDIKYNKNATHLLYYMGNHLPSEDRKEVLSYQLAELGYNQQQINDSSNKEAARAITFFQRSMSIYPYLPHEGYNQLGKAYFRQGQLDSALKYYSKAASEDSLNAPYINNMGTVYYERNDLNKAMIYFQSAYKIDSAVADFSNNIGCIYGKLSRGDSAIYWFQKATAADSLDVKSLQFLDITYRAMRDTASADFYRNRLIYVQQLRQQRL